MAKQPKRKPEYICEVCRHPVPLKVVTETRRSVGEISYHVIDTERTVLWRGRHCHIDCERNAREALGLIQGYAPTVTTKGKVSYVKLGGGLTKKWDEADVRSTYEQAAAVARPYCTSLWHLDRPTPINGLGEPATT